MNLWHSLPNPEENRKRVGRLSGIAGLFVNLGLAGFKAWLGLASGAKSVLADAVNNLSDALSSLLTLVGFHLSSRPADDEHPFGHSRFEQLLSLVVGGLIVYLGVKTLLSSVLPGEESFHFSWGQAGLLFLSVAVKFGLYLFYLQGDRAVSSAILRAGAADSLSDVVGTMSVLLSLAAQKIFGIRLDNIAGAVVSLFILKTGYEVIKDNVSSLLGQSADKELTQKVIRLVESHEGILGTHDLIIHQYGPFQRYATIDCEMDARQTLEKAHAIVDRIERSAQRDLDVQLKVHIDPILPGIKRENAIYAVEEALAAVDPKLSYHDLQFIRNIKGDTLTFDLVVPEDEGESLKALVEERLKKDYPLIDIRLDNQFTSQG